MSFAILFLSSCLFNSCPSNFTGDQCDIDVDECVNLTQPCLNGGTCSNFYGGYTCRCIYGWEGFDCSINIDDCKPSDPFPKCHNGGTCVDKVGWHECICPPSKTGIVATNGTSLKETPPLSILRSQSKNGSHVFLDVWFFLGPICQFDNRCASNPCQGSSTCAIDAFGNASCTCAKGWSGLLCDADIDECNVVNSVCHHGGTCTNTLGSFRCDCIPGFVGEHRNMWFGNLRRRKEREF